MGNRTTSGKNGRRAAARFYQRLLQGWYGHFIPVGSRVLEVGCGSGDLLAALKPSVGVGLDRSRGALEEARRRHPALTFLEADAHFVPGGEPFDFVILSDLVNDLDDVQQVLTALRPRCHSGTRLVMNFHNNLWRPLLSAATRLGWAALPERQNWLTPEDLQNLLELSGYAPVQRRPAILLPFPLPLIAPFFNRVLAHLPGVRAFDLTHFVIARPDPEPRCDAPSVSIIISARNESGHIAELLRRVPDLGKSTEIIFVEGHSIDDTFDEIERQMAAFPEKICRLIRQPGEGKGDAVRAGFELACGEILMILDADGTVPPETLSRFYEALCSGKGEFINGVRLVYPLGAQSMRFFNMVGNKFFGLLFSWLLGQPVRDTLCGTKVLWKRDYEQIARNRSYFGTLDPFGDFDLLFGAARMNLKILEVPIRYGARTYGSTNISRWRHGVLLLRMAWRAAFKLKLI